MFQFLKKDSTDSISVRDIDNLIGKIDLIDIREPYEYQSGHLPTAKNIPMDDILAKPEKYLDKSKEYHIICHSGARSGSACRDLKRMGYKIINVSGGTGSYRGKLER